ncbi:MAG TPA: FliH/SctL family protein [Melioribacteraceae bacterium]|nr:FliH/SctL family protein [Melioribacteraceae bacterium]
MSNVIKVGSASKGLKVVVPGAANAEKNIQEYYKEEENKFKKELERVYQQGFDEGFVAAQNQLEQEFSNQLMSKSEEFYAILSGIEERVQSLENSFEKIVIDVSSKIAQKIINREIENKSIIENTLRNSIGKVLGATGIVVRLHPADYDLLNEGDFIVTLNNSFNKLKFETDDSIERGGGLIETEIGSVDARISTQLNEILSALENSLNENLGN